ncbi:MAG: biotin--[acetyl-CoA-carboxylase] ligase [Tissierellia bacterium]|nr:biotin--[acetyl-CoA-carboxylase] ligase [Tissierellia bacterium]
MSTKDKVLKELEYHRDEFVSGQDLADKLQLSRTAVWKAMDSLRQDGFVIHSTTNRGYQLDKDCDKLSRIGIQKDLMAPLKEMDLYLYDQIDSTNTEAKRLLYSQDVKNFTILVADEQFKGRGRRGKSFQSPKGSGVYLSIILHPEKKFDLNDFDLVTVRAAVAVVKTIKKFVEDGAPSIKWVNDIYCKGKKVCGILSELDADFESKTVSSVIVGIGVNIKKPDGGFDPSVRDIAGWIAPKNRRRNEFVASLMNEFYHVYYEMTDEEVLKIYRDHSLVLGKSLSFEHNGKRYEGIGKDINEKGNLIVETAQGEMVLSSGEISIEGDFLSENNKRY